MKHKYFTCRYVGSCRGPCAPYAVVRAVQSLQRRALAAVAADDGEQRLPAMRIRAMHISKLWVLGVRIPARSLCCTVCGQLARRTRYASSALSLRHGAQPYSRVHRFTAVLIALQSSSGLAGLAVARRHAQTCAQFRLHDARGAHAEVVCRCCGSRAVTSRALTSVVRRQHGSRRGGSER